MSIMIYIVLTILASVCFLLVLNLYEFHPTKYWFAKHSSLFRFLKKTENIDNIPIREIESMLEFLILDRCSEENGIVSEIRNGYILKFYPEGVEPNKRWMESNYVEIYSNRTEATLRCTFINCEPKYQIERRQTNNSLEDIFFYSKQGKMKDFLSRAYTTDGRREILDNYRDFVIRNVM